MKRNDEIVLRLISPRIEVNGEVQITVCEASLGYQPNGEKEWVFSDTFLFKSPIGKVELADINWYLRQFHKWPFNAFYARGKGIEANLTLWGSRLFDAIQQGKAATEVLDKWLMREGSKLFTVQLDTTLLTDVESRSAAANLLQIPWELLCNKAGYLIEQFTIAYRRLNGCQSSLLGSEKAKRDKAQPIRILLVSPRPTVNSVGEPISFFDHRSSTLPIVSAVEEMKSTALVEQQNVYLEIAWPPTLEGIKNCLERAKLKKQPFTIFHFDGHGVFDTRSGKGLLCFEADSDCYSRQERLVDYIFADEVASILRPYDVSLVFLDACETAVTEHDPESSVAGALLEHGVNTVVAMKNQILVDSASRFVEVFYQVLAQGCSGIEAMRQAQWCLFNKPTVISQQSGNYIYLQDWFMASLFDKGSEHIYFGGSAEGVNKRLGKSTTTKTLTQKLPNPARCHFVGRSSELLTIERLLKEHQVVTLLGGGGFGKTALATEVGDWLYRTGAYETLLFVDLEESANLSALGFFESLGSQLSCDYSTALFQQDVGKALESVSTRIGESKALVILDNAESTLQQDAFREVDLCFIHSFIKGITGSCSRLNVLLTSRQTISDDFCSFPVERMDVDDATALVKDLLEKSERKLSPQIVGDIDKVYQLIEKLDGHPRAITLVVNHLIEGIDDTSEALALIFQQLDTMYPNDRQRSLYASIELSLQTLGAGVMETIQPIALCHRGINLHSFVAFTRQCSATVRNCFDQLVEKNLAHWAEFDYLHFDPILSFYLKNKLPSDTLEAWRIDWANEIKNLIESLYNGVFINSKRTFVLTHLELPNLLAYMDFLQERINALEGKSIEDIVNLCAKLEPLIALLNNKRILARLEALRELAGEGLEGWSHAKFEHYRMTVERLHQRGRFGEAISKSRELLALMQIPNNRCYENSEFDFAMTYELLGDSLRLSGQSEEAINYLQQARRLYRNTGERGDRMVFVCVMLESVCYAAKGQYDKAIYLLRICVDGFTRLSDKRSSAIAKGHLVASLREIKAFNEAVSLNYEAISIYEELKEPLSVASSWQSLGMLYQRMEEYSSAEDAFRQSLRIKVQQQHLPGQASSLGQLGNLYENHFQKIDEAIIFYRQSLDIYIGLADLQNQARCRSNIADSLIKLVRFEEAWHEISEACSIIESFSLAFQPWIAFGVKYDVANRLDKSEEAHKAWRSAMHFYKEYRRQGGYPKTAEGLQVKQFEAALATRKNQGEYSGEEALNVTVEVTTKGSNSSQNNRFIEMLSNAFAHSLPQAITSPDIGLTFYQAAEINLVLEKQATEIKS